MSAAATQVVGAGDQAARLRGMMRDGAEPLAIDLHEAGVATEPVQRQDAEPAVRKGIVIAVASGKGGVGKTTLSVNIAAALTKSRDRVTLVDADLGLANADVLCGLNPTRRLDRWLDAPEGGDQRSLEDLVIAGPGGLRLVPGVAGVSRLASLDARQRRTLVDGIEGLASSPGVVVVDTMAGIGGEVRSVCRMADLTLVVATPDPASIADAYLLMKAAFGSTSVGGQIGIVVNRAANEAEAQRTWRRISTAAKRFLGVECLSLGWMPEDRRVTRFGRERRVLSLARGGSARALRRVSRGICAEITRIGGERVRLDQSRGRPVPAIGGNHPTG